jgi:hypothetical protein
MPDRAAIVQKAASEVGYNAGPGDVNKFSHYLGLPGESWCGDFVTTIFELCGLALPSMQPGHRTGYSFVCDGWQYAVDHKITRNSWEAQPADIVCFDWLGTGCANPAETHTGIVDHWSGGILHTIEGNTSPGSCVNRKERPSAAGSGSPQIMGVIDSSKLVKFGGGGGGPAPAPAPAPHHPPVPPPFPGRTLMLKSPPITGDDVSTWQTQMRVRGWHIAADGAYGPESRAACLAFQKQKGLHPTGSVDQQTWAATWSAPVTAQ